MFRAHLETTRRYGHNQLSERSLILAPCQHRRQCQGSGSGVIGPGTVTSFTHASGISGRRQEDQPLDVQFTVKLESREFIYRGRTEPAKPQDHSRPSPSRTTNHTFCTRNEVQ